MLKNGLKSEEKKIRIFSAADGSELAPADMLDGSCYVVTVGGIDIGSDATSVYSRLREFTAGPPTVWPFGGLLTVISRLQSSGKTFIETLSDLVGDYHKDDKMVMRLNLPFGESYNLISAEPDLNFLASENPALFEKELPKESTPLGLIRKFATPLGLFTNGTEAESWEIAHRILLPAFSMKGMKEYFPQLTTQMENLMCQIDGFGPKSYVDIPGTFYVYVSLVCDGSTDRISSPLSLSLSFSLSLALKIS